jgi:hypothetical protein
MVTTTPVILAQGHNRAMVITAREIRARGHSPETVTTVPVTPAKSLARGRNRVREIIARVAIASHKAYKKQKPHENAAFAFYIIVFLMSGQ